MPSKIIINMRYYKKISGNTERTKTQFENLFEDWYQRYWIPTNSKTKKLPSLDCTISGRNLNLTIVQMVSGTVTVWPYHGIHSSNTDLAVHFTAGVGTDTDYSTLHFYVNKKKKSVWEIEQITESALQM